MPRRGPDGGTPDGGTPDGGTPDRSPAAGRVPWSAMEPGADADPGLPPVSLVVCLLNEERL
ncbi:MAG TPA: hypothetical protein VFP72_24565, partial [Kineosporiaceae bacterium]|nr:hypothetical protein [Kineosporiaceae bacterium]